MHALCILLALSLCACNSVATGARFSAPSTESIATRISSAQTAVQRGQVRAQRIQAAVAVPIISPERREQLVRDAGDLSGDLAEATKQLEAAIVERGELRDAVEAQTTALNVTVAERDSERAALVREKEQVRTLKGEISTLEDKLKAESGWWARLKHNAVLFAFAFGAGMLCAWLLRLAGGAAGLAARIGLRASTGLVVAFALMPQPAWAVVIYQPSEGTALAATVGEPFAFVCRASSQATWSASGLPPGLSITSGGAIIGSPKESGTWEVTILATDPPGTPEPDPYEVTITIVVDSEFRALPSEATPAPKAPRQVR